MKPTAGPASIAVGIALLVVLLAGGSPAAAHEGDGQLALQLADPAAPAGPGPVHYQVLLTFLDDGHPAPDATVTAVAEPSGGGAGVGPIAMAPGTAEGTYQATLVFPSAGSWTVRFTAVTPAALLELGQELPAVVTPSAAPPPSGSEPGVPTTVPPPATTTASTVAAPTPAADPPGDGAAGGSAAWLVAAVAILLAAGIALGATVVVRSRRQDRDAGTPPA